LRKPSWAITCSFMCGVFNSGTPSKASFALALSSSGHAASHGSGRRSAMSIARQAANGLRAHHRRRVDGCPWRMDFSRAECFETTAMGKSTSQAFAFLGDCHLFGTLCFFIRFEILPSLLHPLTVLPPLILSPKSTGTTAQTFNLTFGLEVPKNPANQIPAYPRTRPLQIAQ